jgi:hypothetical protein
MHHFGRTNCNMTTMDPLDNFQAIGPPSCVILPADQTTSTHNVSIPSPDQTESNLFSYHCVNIDTMPNQGAYFCPTGLIEPPQLYFSINYGENFTFLLKFKHFALDLSMK